MTAISTIITRRFTARATDFLITPFGERDKAERETSIVPTLLSNSV
jgi:hypothetical protein